VTTTADSGEKVIIELDGAKAQRGLPLANFEAFVKHFRRALTDFDRQTRGEPTRRHPCFSRSTRSWNRRRQWPPEPEA
jgi:hypothetical protein